ncbi:MAG TPA: DUF1127 domain-containing protein [Candidatus Competibacteraceae bacterium]|nr:DUF1127 domain-containing protein [Candidatus Competibacteraceae bacterium]
MSTVVKLSSLSSRSAAAVQPRPTGWLRTILARIVRWHELARQRRALVRASDALLRDIGISRMEADYEASRPFWDDPFGGRPLLRRRDQR